MVGRLAVSAEIPIITVLLAIARVATIKDALGIRPLRPHSIRTSHISKFTIGVEIDIADGMMLF